MFDIGLTTLKEIHLEIDKIVSDELDGRETDRARKSALTAGRQRALASLFTLLCLREQYDLIEEIQSSPYEKRLRLLDEYFAELSAHSAAAARLPSGEAARV